MRKAFREEFQRDLPNSTFLTWRKTGAAVLKGDYDGVNFRISTKKDDVIEKFELKIRLFAVLKMQYRKWLISYRSETQLSSPGLEAATKKENSEFFSLKKIGYFTENRELVGRELVGHDCNFKN